jgi:hypothetical protein
MDAVVDGVDGVDGSAWTVCRVWRVLWTGGGDGGCGVWWMYTPLPPLPPLPPHHTHLSRGGECAGVDGVEGVDGVKGVDNSFCSDFLFLFHLVHSAGSLRERAVGEGQPTELWCGQRIRRVEGQVSSVLAVSQTPSCASTKSVRIGVLGISFALQF